ncbi:M28 family peptidase [Alicycliphilus denitrificans]|uniref:M28 family peptidase n=1 Tax=Alicycliphilus denitrificans TaxID=179636 RepID=UPI003A802199
MLTEIEKEILAHVSTEAGWELVEAFARTRRELPEEFQHGAAMLAERLRAAGLTVKQETPDLYLGIPRHAEVRCEGRVFRSKATALSPNQPAITAKLVHVPARDGSVRTHSNDPAVIFGDGVTRESLKARVQGRIVLTEGLSNPGRSDLMEKLGALAVITINPGKSVHWGASSTVWGNPLMDDMERLPRMVSMAVNREDGDALAAAAVRGAEVTIEAEVLHGWFPQTITTVEIQAEGPFAHEFVLLHGHLDSWDLGVGDNATGNATLMEVARVLHANRRHLRRSVRIAWWPGHSAGRYAGSTWYADRHAFELHEDCVAHINCDSPGCKDATDYSRIRGMAEAQPLVAGAVADLFRQECKLDRPTRGGDYSFNNLGVSGALLTSSMVPAEERKRRGWYTVGGNGGSPTWHTEDDVFEVADRAVLENDVRLYALVALRLAAVDAPQLDYRIPVRDLSQRLAQARQQAGATVDLALHERLAAQLAEALDACYDADASAPRVPRWPAVKRAARSIVRAGYAERGVFEQDSAYATPFVPLLAAVSQIGRHPAATTSLQRGANLLRAELAHALSAVAQS